MLEQKLVQLPRELLHMIIERLPTVDRLSLRLTCQELNSLVTRILFRSLKLNRHFLDHFESKEGPAIIAPYVRNLILGWPWNSFPIGNSPVLSIGETENNIGTDEMLAIHLESFIRKLKELQSVTWNFCPSFRFGFPAAAVCMQRVDSALADLPSLKEVKINISQYYRGEPIPSMSGFGDLYSLHVTRNLLYDISITGFLRSVMSVVVASPMLRSLHVHFVSNSLRIRVQESNCTFNSLVHDLNIWRPDTTPVLQDLGLVGIPVQLSSELHHVFQNLKHLTLAYGADHDINRSHHAYDRHLSSMMNSIGWADIWNALYDAGIKGGLWLETLDTEGVQPESALTALFNYLGSHPGLKNLCIRQPRYDKERGTVDASLFEAGVAQNRQRATEFWCEIIPHHTHSLRELSVVPLKQGPWSYCPNASTTIRQCTLLRKLKISISDVDGDWALEKAAKFEMADWRPASDLKSELHDQDSDSQSDTHDQDSDSQSDTHNQDSDSQADTVVWGQLSTCPVLIASDLENLLLLEDVQITAAEPYSRWNRNNQPLLRQTQRILERFVPPKGYPHELSGNHGIIKIQGMNHTI